MSIKDEMPEMVVRSFSGGSNQAFNLAVSDDALSQMERRVQANPTLWKDPLKFTPMKDGDETLTGRIYHPKSNLDEAIESLQSNIDKRIVEEMASTKMRLVKVLVVDPDDRIPVMEDRVLYEGGFHLTDSTNEEIYMGLGIGEVLKEHNDRRTKLRDEEASITAGRDVFLKPIKIRDLKMAVVELAAF